MASASRSPRSTLPADGVDLLADVGALSGGYDFSIYWTSKERGTAAERMSQYEAECNETTQRVIALLHEHCSAGKILAQYKVLARLAADMRERERERAETAAELRRLTDAEHAHATTIKQQEVTITARGQTIDGLRAEVRQLEERVQQRDARIEALVAEIKRPRSPEPAASSREQYGASAQGRGMESETRKTTTEQATFASSADKSRFPDRAPWGLGSAMESSFNSAWMRGGTGGIKDGGFSASVRYQRQASERRGEEQRDVHRVVVSETKQGEGMFGGYSTTARDWW
ncbi:hypothetical protein AURDEDRAFT_126228 [Auricularia subglabra TFB-10046 SS5]|nr:hypothetical protein AURDEDRAFT_126228 [Auricularia subglabra TFB-10046 SS5]